MGSRLHWWLSSANLVNMIDRLTAHVEYRRSKSEANLQGGRSEADRIEESSNGVVG